MNTEEIDAFSIPEWARRHSLSVQLFYKLQREGRGPRTMHVGKRTLISAEAAAQWRREREADSANVPAVQDTPR